MSETTVVLRGKISDATDLRSVVRTMKSVAAAQIGQYESAIAALDDYLNAVELGLQACLRNPPAARANVQSPTGKKEKIAGFIVFGSDQGLVGRFNDSIALFTLNQIKDPARKTLIWSVGERVRGSLNDVNLVSLRTFAVPTSAKAITPFVDQILLDCESRLSRHEVDELSLVYNQMLPGAVYQPVCVHLLPLDETWKDAANLPRWPKTSLPQVIGQMPITMAKLLSEYVFISIFRASAQSLASENASRLQAMQRADENIKTLLNELTIKFHRQRQSGIDEELFDVISSFEALTSSNTH